MEQLLDLMDRLLESLRDASQTILLQLPSLLVAAIVIAVGWALARLLRFGAIRAIERVDWLMNVPESRSAKGAARSRHALVRAAGAVVFWIVFLSFLAAALRSLEVQVIDEWMSRLLAYLPVLAGGLLIIFLAFVGGTLIRQVVEPAAESVGAVNSGLIGRLIQIAVVVTGLVVGTGALGIDVTFVIQLTTVVVGVALAGLALAFALGTRDHLANLVGIRYARKHIKTGELVKIAGHSGRIIEFANGYLLLETTDGDISIPGSYFSREPFIKTADERPDDD